jgi:hypothetical protein
VSGCGWADGVRVGGRSRWPCVQRRQSPPEHTLRISFSRGAHEAVALRPEGHEVRRCLFTCQISRQPRLRTERTIEEHESSVKHPRRDLLDRHPPARYTRLDDRESCWPVDHPWDRGLPARPCGRRSGTSRGNCWV